MALKWEFLGNQELWEGDGKGKGYAYQLRLWRTPVPGGWLLMAVNGKSSSPDPVMSFYPDPRHAWTGRSDPQAEILLRPASPGLLPTGADYLLRAATPEEETPQMPPE